MQAERNAFAAVAPAAVITGTEEGFRLLVMLAAAAAQPHEKLSPYDIGRLKDAGEDPTGEVYVHPKDGSGPGDPTGIKLNDLP